MHVAWSLGTNALGESIFIPNPPLSKGGARNNVTQHTLTFNTTANGKGYIPLTTEYVLVQDMNNNTVTSYVAGNTYLVSMLGLNYNNNPAKAGKFHSALKGYFSKSFIEETVIFVLRALSFNACIMICLLFHYIT